MDSSVGLAPYPTGVSRDDKYYIPVGDVTILVSKTLFRVHKHVLARDGSTFEDMFSFDSDVDPDDGENDTKSFVQDGADDEHPIVMQGDEEDGFRDLLWCLYALPQKILEATTPKTEDGILKLANIAHIANKYHFVTTELWALQCLTDFFRSEPPNSQTQAQQGQTRGQTQRVPLSTSTLVKVTEVAALCEGREHNNILLDALRPKWKSLIHTRSDVGLALSVTERLGLRDLCGLAYHSMLQQGREDWDRDPHLTREHRIRLLSGFHKVTQFCDLLPSSPPAFTHHPNCIDGPEECGRAWKAFWKSMMSLDPDVGVGSQAMRHEKLDVLGRLMMAVSIMQTLEKGELHTLGTHPFEECDECHRPAMLATVVVCKKVQDELMDFFPDVV